MTRFQSWWPTMTLRASCTYVFLFVRVLICTCSYSYVFLCVRDVFLFVRVLICACSYLSEGLKTHPWAWKIMKLSLVFLSHEMAFCSWQNARLGRFGCRWSSGNILTIPSGHKSNAIITKITQCQERHNWKSSENQKGNKNQTFWPKSESVFLF